MTFSLSRGMSLPEPTVVAVPGEGWSRAIRGLPAGRPVSRPEPWRGALPYGRGGGGRGGGRLRRRVAGRASLHVVRPVPVGDHLGRLHPGRDLPDPRRYRGQRAV